MPNIFHDSYKITQPYACTEFNSEPPITINGVYYPHYHRGIDLVGPTPHCAVYASVPGAVYSCGTDTDGAIYVIELADDGTWHLYWHLSKLLVKAGQRLDNTVKIGNQGMTGNATGNHVHYEVDEPQTWPGHTLALTPLDPLPYLQEGDEMKTTEMAEAIYLTLGWNNTEPSKGVIQQKADHIDANGRQGLIDVINDVRNAAPWSDPDQVQAITKPLTEEIEDCHNIVTVQYANIADFQKQINELTAELEALKDAPTTTAPTTGNTQPTSDPIKDLINWLKNLLGRK